MLCVHVYHVSKHNFSSKKMRLSSRFDERVHPANFRDELNEGVSKWFKRARILFKPKSSLTALAFDCRQGKVRERRKLARNIQYKRFGGRKGRALSLLPFLRSNNSHV